MLAVEIGSRAVSSECCGRRLAVCPSPSSCKMNPNFARVSVPGAGLLRILHLENTFHGTLVLGQAAAHLVHNGQLVAPITPQDECGLFESAVGGFSPLSW